MRACLKQRREEQGEGQFGFEGDRSWEREKGEHHAPEDEDEDDGRVKPARKLCKPNHGRDQNKQRFKGWHSCLRLWKQRR